MHAPSGVLTESRGLEGCRFESRLHERSDIYKCLTYVNLLMIERLPAGVVRKFGNWVPVQVSSSSSDHSSELRGPYRNFPRVASKRNLNLSKPN
ncbi:hypothetical protein AVEN_188416-1 [Araneus ventricosus]|uniref:Uncharacterized protein n=1 Tax=Araneus ventricosus TaxID=182803 RepID=A0A4Y2KDH3_ARAVE|nr:hypothetical protein AVEN_188416-1 [Araneus ventricosus]